jgi:hypothetical protein
VDAIFRSWALLLPEIHQSLVSKLSARLPKALCHGVRAGTISSSAVAEKQDIIKNIYSVALEKVSEAASISGGHKQLWKRWRLIDAESMDRDMVSKEARARLARLPNTRKSL